MRKATEYQKYAQECRDLAKRMQSAEHREQLLEMAKHWERMERERIEFISSHPEFAVGPFSESDDEPAPKRH